MAANNAGLRLDGVSASYCRDQRVLVIQDVSLAVRPGEVVGLVGRNGSGKTSTLSTVMRRLYIANGRVRVGETDVTDLAPAQIVRAGVRSLPQGGRVFTEMSVLDNLRTAAVSFGLRDRDAVTREALSWFSELGKRPNLRAGLLSGGQRQMLSLAMVLAPPVVRPPNHQLVVLLDEPSGSLDPEHRSILTTVLHRMRDELRAAILLAEEDIGFATRVCGRFYQFFEPGRVRMMDSS